MLYKPQKIVFSLALLCCTALRIYLKLVAVDPATGFYAGNLIVPSIFSWILGIGCVGLLLAGRIAKNKPIAASLHESHVLRLFTVLSGIAALVFAGASLLDEVVNLLTINAHTSGPALVSSLLLAVAGIFCLIVAPVVTGFLFLATGIKGVNAAKRPHGALLLFPVLWQTAVLLTTFMSYTRMRSVSDQLLSIAMLILMVPFLLANGRMLSGIDTEKGTHQLMMFGLPFSLIAIPFSIGILCASFAGKTVAIGPTNVAAAFYLCMGIYAVSMVFSLKKEKE